MTRSPCRISVSSGASGERMAAKRSRRQHYLPNGSFHKALGLHLSFEMRGREIGPRRRRARIETVLRAHRGNSFAFSMSMSPSRST
jgi:hypothetical protein